MKWEFAVFLAGFVLGIIHEEKADAEDAKARLEWLRDVPLSGVL